MSARIGRCKRYVLHHMEMLSSFQLVKEEGEAGDGETLYIANLKEHPAWVAKTVDDRRPPD
ncbi:MAG TPA: hypothetical protein VF085_12120 [Solirubrobacterales bacterium]